MDQKAFQIRLSQWEKIVIEGNKASISKKEWCKQNGISEKSFYYWQRKIRMRAAETIETATVPVPSPKTDFVELPFPSAQQHFDEHTPLSGLSPELMIQIGECRIFVTGAIQEQTLKTVLKAVGNA